ncbi:MAG: hypothetical protein GKS01_08105 [Alphaproteobacteria bacterium]|nr:hypothetical protein [Alphaproteobacteria bacterium]
MANTDTMEEFDEDDQEVFEIEPSNLDDSTHTEVIALYADAQDNIRFSKNLQWRAMSGAIVLFVLLVLSCRLTDSGATLVNSVICASFLVSAGAIYSLAILQSWQGTEREKIKEVVGKLSNLSTLVYGLRSRMEANVHRFILLTFMIAGVLGANYFAVVLLMPLVE